MVREVAGCGWVVAELPRPAQIGWDLAGPGAEEKENDLPAPPKRVV